MVRSYFLCMLMVFSHCLMQAQSLDKGLILNLAFNNTIEDASKFGNDGMVMGNTSFEEDRFGNACSAVALDGANSYVSIPSSGSLNSPSKSLTISAWIKPKHGKMNTYGLMWFTVCSKGNRAKEAANSPHYRFQVSSKTVSINTSFTENADIAIQPNLWYHCVLVYDGSAVKTYVNDELVHSYPFSETLYPNDQPLEIGRDIPGNLEMHHGLVDDLRIYNRALNAREVGRLYRQPAQGTVGNCTNLVASNTPAPSEPIIKHDTVVVYLRDTVRVQNTVYQRDTVEIVKRDTVRIYDTDTLRQVQEIIKYDTLIREVVRYDTIEVLRRDTVFVTRNNPIRDTIRVPVPADTVRIIQRDTVYVNREVVENGIVVPDYSPFEKENIAVGDRLVLRYIEFKKGTYELVPGYEPTLVKLVNWMQQYPGRVIRLDGHTDSFGGKEMLLKLSLERADAVKRILVANGVNSNRIKTKGFGGSDPRNDNSTNKKKAENRRVEVTILKLK